MTAQRRRGSGPVTLRAALAIVGTAITVAGTAGAFVHKELVLPSVLAHCDERMDRKLAAHANLPHAGAVTARELQLLMRSLDRVHQRLDAIEARLK